MPALNCLSVCGLRDGIAAIRQFCIDTRLAFALKGDIKKGLFFRGSESLPFGNSGPAVLVYSIDLDQASTGLQATGTHTAALHGRRSNKKYDRKRGCAHQERFCLKAGHQITARAFLHAQLRT